MIDARRGDLSQDALLSRVALCVGSFALLANVVLLWLHWQSEARSRSIEITELRFIGDDGQLVAGLRPLTGESGLEIFDVSGKAQVNFGFGSGSRVALMGPGHGERLSLAVTGGIFAPNGEPRMIIRDEEGEIMFSLVAGGSFVPGIVLRSKLSGEPQLVFEAGFHRDALDERGEFRD